MKKIIKNMKISILSFSLMLGMLFVTPAKANSSSYNKDILYNINEAIGKINEIEKTSVIMTDYYELYDVEMNPSYLMVKLDLGYMIITKENGIISEYSLSPESVPFSNLNGDNLLIYGGPGTYFEISKNSVNNRSSENLLLELSSDEIFVSKNREFLSLSKELDNTSSGQRQVFSDGYVGIPTTKFSRYYGGTWSHSYYSSWDSSGICGTMAVSVLLAHYDDYRNNNIVPNSIRTQNSSSAGSLVSTIYNYADNLYPSGTTEANLVSAISSYLTVYAPSLKTSHKAVTSVGTTSAFTGIKTILAAEKPVIILLLTSKGYTGNDNHWVIAYQYYDASGTTNDYYRCHDANKSGQVSYNVFWASELDFLYLAS